MILIRGITVSSALLLAATSSGVLGSTRTVANLNDSGPGSLRQAISELNAIQGVANSISFQSGLTGVITLTSSELAIDQDNLTINGPGSGVISLNGNHQRRIFHVLGGLCTINDLTITNGYVRDDEGGGGIRNHAGLTLNRCVITNCSTSNTVINSSMGWGAGIDNGGTLTMNDCTVASNSSASEGGGVIVRQGCTLQAARCTFSSNGDWQSGGGLSLRGNATLTNCTITGNSTAGQSALFLSAGGLIVQSEDTPVSVTLINCTVAYNHGGGFAAERIHSSDANLTLMNTLVSANEPGNVFSGLGANVISQGNNFDSDGTSGFVNGVNGDIVGTLATPLDPHIASLADNGGYTRTHAIYADSPVINKATNTGAPATDQRGLPRPGTGCGASSGPDIGAFESQDGGFVVTTLADSGVGSLRNILQVANAFTCSKDITFAVTGTIMLTGGQLGFGRPARILGPGAGKLTISANNASRIFNFQVADVAITIADVTLQSGKAADGGAILNVSNLTLNRCVIKNSSTTGTGGGVKSYSSLVATDCTFSNNSASTVGGGIYNAGITLTLTNCTFSGNSAGQGGALYSENFPITLTNCTLSGNTASAGAALYNAGPTATLESCTIAANTSTAGGNCIGGTIKYRNTIFANAAGPNFTGTGSYQSLGHNISSDGTGNLGAAGDKPNTNPLLAALASNGGYTQTHALLLGSPAIDAGDPVIFPASDQRGVARPVDGDASGIASADIGSYEGPIQIPDDFDRDGDVDKDDLAIFDLCMTGPSLPGPPVGCSTARFQLADGDHDNDVDMRDFGIFQRCFSGANRPATPTCGQ